MNFFELLTSTALENGAYRANVIEVNDIEFDVNFRSMCESNYCGMYGKCYMCPPIVGNPENLISKSKEYDYALIFQTVTKLEDSYDFEEMLEAKNGIQKLISKFRDVFGQRNIYDVIFLGPGGCGVCKKCTKESNEPCRFPQLAIHSLEAYCINVYKLANSAKMKYVNGQDTVTYFAAILFKGDFCER